MTPFFPTLVRAFAGGAAFETGKELARRNGLGFLQMEGGEDSGSDYANCGFDYNYSDPWDYGFDFFSGGGGWPDLNFDPYAYQSPAPEVSASGDEDRYWFDWGQYLSDWLSGNVLSIDSYGQGSGQRTPYGGESSGFPDWLPGPGPASMDPQYGPAGSGQGLPGYCPQGQYHPLNDPFACVPFPPNDPNAKKQASQQQRAQQQAANAAKKAQRQQDKTCPKHPQGLPVWKNPATGKCEVMPQCPQGAKFDSATRRCLTAAQAKELYGDNNWWIWLLIAAGALVVVNSGSSSGGRRR